MQQDVNYRKLFEVTSLPRFIVDKEQGGSYTIKEANAAACELFDKTQEQLVSMTLAEIVGGHCELSFQTSFEKALEEKIAVSMPCPPELDFKHVGRFLISPIVDRRKGERNEIGVRYEVSCVPHDETSAALQRERDDAISLLTSVFDVSEIGIVVTDRHQRIVRINDSFVRIYGWTRDELIGEKVVKLAVEEERAQVEKFHEEFVKSGLRTSGEMKVQRKDGKVANVLFTTAMLDLSQGRRFQVTTIMDITLRKQMEQNLRNAKEMADTANNAKSTFLANMSHELRTPLNAIIGFSEMIKNETFGPIGVDKYKEYIGDVYNSACHLLEIINEVLDMSKIEAGKVELDECYFKVQDIMDSVNRMMASRAFSSGLMLQMDIQDDLPRIFADHRLVRQILINLVSNAFKYAEKGGFVYMRAWLNDEGEMCMAVEDNGVGIPKDRIREALEPFGQVNKTANNATRQGTGLGLPLAKAMAELHGGRLTLESEVGEGTTVTVVFPAKRLKEGLDKLKESDSPIAAIIQD